MPAWFGSPSIVNSSQVIALHAGDGADAAAFGVEDRALLDVELEIGVRFDRAGLELARIADAAELVADGKPVVVTDGVGLVERQRAGPDAAAEDVGVEAHALLVGEGDDRDRTLRRDPGLLQGRDGFERRKHPERAVVAPAGRDSVDVGAEHHGRAVALARHQAEDVADPVDPDIEAELPHPRDEKIPALAVLVGQRQPAAAAVAGVADPGQGFEPPQQAVAVDAEIGRDGHGRIMRRRSCGVIPEAAARGYPGPISRRRSYGSRVFAALRPG